MVNVVVYLAVEPVAAAILEKLIQKVVVVANPAARIKRVAAAARSRADTILNNKFTTFNIRRVFKFHTFQRQIVFMYNISYILFY